MARFLHTSIFFLTPAFAAGLAWAAPITLPTITPAPLAHTYVQTPISGIYLATDSAQALGSAASSYNGGYQPGDIVTFNFVAPVGYIYQFNLPVGAFSSKFGVTADFAAVTPDTLDPGLTPTAFFGGLSGAAPSLSGNSFVQDRQGTGLLGAEVGGTVTSPFSFTSVTITYTIPTGFSAPVGALLPLVILNFSGSATLPQSAGDPGPFFTLQPVPEPEMAFAVSAGLLVFGMVRRRRCR